MKLHELRDDLDWQENVGRTGSPASIALALAGSVLFFFVLALWVGR